MRWFRSLLLFVSLVLLVIVYGCACTLAFPFMTVNRRYRMGLGWCYAALFVARCFTGIRYRVEGLENLPDSPALVLSKHQSAWETIALPVILPRPLCYVFKRELLYIPFFGWTLSMVKMIHINRSDARHAFASITKQGRQRTDEGAWVVMFPEGTRTAPGQHVKYKTGGARFAVALGLPVIPVAHNAAHVWPRNSFIKYPGTVTVSIGKPISTAGLSADEVNQRVEDWIEGEMRRIDPQAYPPANTASTTNQPL